MLLELGNHSFARKLLCYKPGKQLLMILFQKLAPLNGDRLFIHFRTLNATYLWNFSQKVMASIN